MGKMRAFLYTHRTSRHWDGREYPWKITRYFFVHPTKEEAKLMEGEGIELLDPPTEMLFDEIDDLLTFAELCGCIALPSRYVAAICNKKGAQVQKDAEREQRRKELLEDFEHWLRKCRVRE